MRVGPGSLLINSSAEKAQQIRAATKRDDRTIRHTFCLLAKNLRASKASDPKNNTSWQKPGTKIWKQAWFR